MIPMQRVTLPHLRLGSAAILGLFPIAALASPSTLSAQGDVDQDGFVVCLGEDTLAVERYSRTATRLQSEIVLRAPVARRVMYSAAIEPGGTLRSFTLEMEPLSPGPTKGLPSRSTVRFDADTADVSLTLNDTTRWIRMAARPGSMPLAAFSHALVEQAILHAALAGGDSVAFDWVGVGATKAYPAYVKRAANGRVAVGLFQAPAVVQVDAEGRILALDGRETSVKVEVTRVKAPDLEHFARAFVAAESARGPVGQLSPRDTASALVGSGRVTVDYGRPWKRGRVIFGGVVPWGRVWRTGANQATELVDRPAAYRGGPDHSRRALHSLDHPPPQRRDPDRQSAERAVGHRLRADHSIWADSPCSGTGRGTPAEQFTIDVVPRSWRGRASLPLGHSWVRASLHHGHANDALRSRITPQMSSPARCSAATSSPSFRGWRGWTPR